MANRVGHNGKRRNLVFAFYMSGLMSLCMSGVVTFFNGEVQRNPQSNPKSIDGRTSGCSTARMLKSSSLQSRWKEPG